MDEVEKLLLWFAAKKRSLPWRESQDPYLVWISEIMLQQTQVRTVIPYYESFVRRFPTVEVLAASALDDVLAAWSGLGYYRRARQMHLTARQIVESRDGFPTSSAELLKLPGVGAYTAAAVASIAFNEVIPALDGNVERVMARRLAIVENPKRAASRKTIVEAVGSLLDPSQPGESNQALMELGATVCRPRQPTCEVCPLASGCLARRSGNPERFPSPRRRRGVARISLAVVVAQQKGRVLLFKRSETSTLMAGLWELPNIELKGSSEDMETALKKEYGGTWKLGSSMGRVSHMITHRALILHIYSVLFEAGDAVAEYREAAWIAARDRSNYAASSLVDKALRIIGFLD